MNNNNLNNLNNFHPHIYNEQDEVIQNLFRNDSYLMELYDIREAVNFSDEITKLYGYTRDKGLGVVISKQEINIQDENDITSDILKRIMFMTKFVEENIILVENIWIEENSNSMNNINMYNIHNNYPNKNSNKSKIFID
jgi:chemotaxis regulatin CheY-phosphate phosphatase CheZ